MRVSATIGAALALCTSALAWDITFYSDSSCADDNGDYVRIPINSPPVLVESSTNALLQG